MIKCAYLMTAPLQYPCCLILCYLFFEVATVCRTLFAGTTQEQHSITSYSERLRSGAKLCPAYTSRLLCVASPVRSCTLTQKGRVCQSGRAGECAWRSMDQQGITHTGRGWQTEIRRRRCPTEKLCCSGASIVSVLPSSRRTNSIEPLDCMPPNCFSKFIFSFFFSFLFSFLAHGRGDLPRSRRRPTCKQPIKQLTTPTYLYLL